MALAGQRRLNQTKRKQAGEASSVKNIRDIAYRDGDGRALRLDLAMPTQQSKDLRPALVIVRGGGGSKGIVGELDRQTTDEVNKGTVWQGLKVRPDGFAICGKARLSR